MKKIAFGLIVLYALVLFIAPGLNAQETYDISNYFPLDVGNTWEYDARKAVSGAEGVEELAIMRSSIQGPEMLNAEEVVVLEENDRGPWLYLASKPEGILLYKTRYMDHYDLIEEPQFLFYPKSLGVGQEAKHSTSIKSYDLSNNLIAEGTLELVVRLEEVKDLTVPAGTFNNCIKLYRSISTKTGKGNMDFTEIQWLAPDTGKVSGQHTIAISNGNSINFQEKFELKSAVVKGNKIGNIKKSEEPVQAEELPKIEEPSKIEESPKVEEQPGTEVPIKTE
ncbi:MAG: hypothetical protein M0R66_04045 [Candidatus Omnitrophica bacterium]|nr:hypothetical protein [Candidatus Omnitrophota bacterium]